jgi:outer membrane receptor protein involved in Fe transport
MNAKKNYWLKTLVAILTLGIAGNLLPVYAQEDDDDVYTISPFTVTEDENVGYLARSSLAGTRLNTPLRDIAATVSVITQEFLDDTGSSDLQELLVYTAGTEISGIGGNFSNPDSTNVVSGVQEQNYRDPIRNTRVRGLAAADLTRNYFSTIIAMDSYNTSRVVINRGANATLFGLGSPAGIINNQTITPVFENHGEISFQVGSYDSHRTELDFEHVLIEDKLSLRVAILNEEKKYQQDPAFEHDKRIYGVAEWRPYENTTIRASFESGSITANRPRSLPPQDLVSAWFLPGPEGTPKPTHNPYQGGGTNYRFPGTYVPDDLSTPDVNEWSPGTARSNYFGFGGYTFEPVLVYAGPQFAVPGGALPHGAQGIVYIQPGGNRSFDASNGASSQSFATMRGTAENLGAVTADHPDSLDQNGNSKSATRGFYTNHVVMDTTLFDFQNLLIDGPNKSEREWFDALNLSVEQTWLDGDAGLSYQMNKEDYRSDFDARLSIGSRFQGLGIDLNTHTREGDVNPNFGRVWISGSRGFINTRSQTLENHRVTGYYKFDLSEFDQNDGLLGQILGTHVFTGLWENARDNSTSIAWYQPALDSRWRAEGDGARAVNSVRNVGAAEPAHLVYVSGDISGQSSSAGANISNWKTKFDIQPEYDIRFLNYDTNAYETGTFQAQERAYAGSPSQNNNTLKQNINIESKALILQSRFLDDHVIANYGYREDDVEVFTNDNAPRNSDNSRNITPSAWQLPDRPTFQSSTDATNWGVVAHLPDEWMESFGGLGLSFHYAKSENAQIGTERINLRGESLSPVSGETTEYGLTIEINDWLSIRYNEYETLQIAESSIGLTNSFRPLIQLYANYLSTRLKQEVVDYVKANPADWPIAAQNPDDFLNFVPFDSPLGQSVEALIDPFIDSNGDEVDNGPPAALAFSTDLLSEGKEIEAVANITSNWRVLLNITQQEVSATNTGGLLRQWIDGEVNPNLARFGEFPLSDGGSETINNWLGRNAITAINRTLAEDGAKKTNEIREWRWNLVTNYEFDQDSGMAGFNIGGAYRWQDSVGIGRPLIVVDGAFTPDLANPFFGPSQDRFDAWVGWEKGIGTYLGQNTLFRVQLNVRNLLDDTDLIPVVADPDGGISVVRISDERTFELRASLSY